MPPTRCERELLSDISHSVPRGLTRRRLPQAQHVDSCAPYDVDKLLAKLDGSAFVRNILPAFRACTAKTARQRSVALDCCPTNGDASAAAGHVYEFMVASHLLVPDHAAERDAAAATETAVLGPGTGPEGEPRDISLWSFVTNPRLLLAMLEIMHD